MQLKRVVLIFTAAFCFATSTEAQSINNYIRVPRQGVPVIIRHPLADVRNPGETFEFRYEVEPARSMLRRINRSFPEASPVATESEDLSGQRNTLAIEELDREALQALMNPDKASKKALTATATDIIKPENNPQHSIGSMTSQIASATEISGAAKSLIGSMTAGLQVNQVATPAAKLP